MRIATYISGIVFILCLLVGFIYLSPPEMPDWLFATLFLITMLASVVLLAALLTALDVAITYKEEKDKSEYS